MVSPASLLSKQKEILIVLIEKTKSINPSDVSRESLASENGQSQHSFLTKLTTMKKNQNVFIDQIKLETQTVFFQNGGIHTSPCAFEENPNLIPNGDRVSQKGRMVTLDDGTSSFRPYASDSGSRYRTLFLTPHGEVKETKDKIIFQLRFHKRLGKAAIMAMLRDEQQEQLTFIKKRRSKIIWAS